MNDWHHALDIEYGTDADEKLRQALLDGLDPDNRKGDSSETLLHVAVRRRRESAVRILLEGGADINAKTAGGKTAFAHAIRRGFSELTTLLENSGADTSLSAPDHFAVAVVSGDLEKAELIKTDCPGVAQTGNPEEDRLLADVAGRNPAEPVQFLIHAGADLSAPGLDDGTPLHQTAWFGQPTNARLLVEAGAPLEIFDRSHGASPLGWAAHGSRFSGGADERQDRYVEITRLLLQAGAKLSYPGDDDGGAYRDVLLQMASERVRSLLEAVG